MVRCCHVVGCAEHNYAEKLTCSTRGCFDVFVGVCNKRYLTQQKKMFDTQAPARVWFDVRHSAEYPSFMVRGQMNPCVQDCMHPPIVLENGIYQMQVVSGAFAPSLSLHPTWCSSSRRSFGFPKGKETTM